MSGPGDSMHLECDCGFVAVGRSEEGIVSSAKDHAWSAHHIEMSGVLILALATKRKTSSEEYDTD